MFGSSFFNPFNSGGHHNPPPSSPSTYQFTAFKGSDIIGGGRNYLSIGYSFVMPAVATTCLTVTDNDGKLSGDQKKNEKGDDKSYQTADIEHNGVQVQDDVKIYAEQYYLLKGSDGQIYKLLEIEIKGLSQYGNDKVDYYSFIGDVPPAGVSLKVIGVKEVSSDGIKYSDLGAGPKEAGPEFGVGDTAGDATEITDLAPGENTTTHTASGTIAFTDNVGDTHTIDVVPDAVGYRGALTAVVSDETDVDGNGQVDWEFTVEDSDLDDLAEGQSVVQNYDLVLEDNNGGTSIRQVSITLTGRNDAPTILTVNTFFNQSFETDSARVFDSDEDWFGSITRVPSGTNGIVSPTGSEHAIITQGGPSGDETGAFTRFDGYRSTFPGTYVTEVKVYLDPAWANGEGFDYSVASNNSSGNHLRDFILHVAKDTSSNQLLVAASNNTSFDPREDLDTLPSFAAVTTAGWYTIQHVFYDDGGVLAVDVSLLELDGDPVFTQTLSDPSDLIGTVGGNRYGWFTNIDVTGGIAVDAYKLTLSGSSSYVQELPDGSSDEGATLSNTGTIAFGDVDTIDLHTVSVTPHAGGYVGALTAVVADDSTGDHYGSVNWTFSVLDANLDELAAGETIVQTYDVTIDDGEGGTATETVTVTITGTNDAPVISGDVAATVAEPGDIPSVDEAGLGGGLEPLFSVVTNMSVLLTTPGDLGAVLASVESELGDPAQAIAAVWDYLDDIYVSAGPNQINVNEAFVRLGVEYVEYLQDGGSPLFDVVAKFAPDNGSDVDTLPERNQSLHDNLLGNLSQAALDQRFGAAPLNGSLGTLIGSFDPDLLTRTYYDGQDNHPAQETAARQFDLDNGFVPTATGTLVANDVDSGATHTWSVASGAGTYGTFEIDPVTGEWKYTLDSAAADHLAEGDSEIESFEVTVSDGFIGGTDTVFVEITVNGTNDAPVIQSSSVIAGAIAPEILAGINEAGPGPLEPTGGTVTPTIQAQLDLIPTDPDTLATILANIEAEIGGDTAKAIAIVWDYIDDNYSYYNNAINEAAVRLGLAYVDYLQNGGTPLFNITAKYTADGGDAGTNPDRMQSLHDNLLGNLHVPSMQDKLLGSGDGGSNPSPVPGLYATLFALVDAADVEARPIYSGNEGAANNALPFDVANGLAGPGSTGGTLVATDVDAGALLAWSADSLAGAYGTFTLDPGSGEWTYTPDASAIESLGVGDSVVDSFIATVTDEHGASDSVTVTVTVNGINDAPVAADDSFATDTLTPVVGNVLDDNGNGADSDVDANDTLTVKTVPVDNVDHGTLVLSSDGSFTYTPNSGFAGTDSFTYQLEDGHGGTDTATVTIAVEAAAAAGEVLVLDAGGSIIYTTNNIQDAIDHTTADGQTVLIGAGTYSGAGNANIVVDRPLTIKGAGKGDGAGDTIVNAAGASFGFSVDLGADSPAGTVTFMGLAVINAQGDGIRAYEQDILGTLVVDNVRVEGSVNSGLFVGGRQASTAYAQAGVQSVVVTDSDFVDNGQSSGNSANLFLYEYDGDATLSGLTVSNGVPGTNSAAYGIQISGVDGPVYDQIGPYAAAGQTYDVLAAIGNVTFEDVTVSGNYRKPGLYVQGYTDMTGLQFVSGNTVDVNSTSWGKPVIIDPMADQLPTGMPGTPANGGSFFDDSAANGSYDLSGLTVIAPSGQFNELDGTTKADTIVGTSISDLITGFGDADNLAGGDGDDAYIADASDTIVENVGEGIDHVFTTDSFTLSANVENLTLLDDNAPAHVEDFESFALGAISDGENGWKYVGGAKDQEIIVDPDDASNQVFRMSSDPSVPDFSGPYSPALLETAGESTTTAAHDSIRMSFTFKAFSPGDDSRLEVDFGNAAGTDRNNFLVIENTVTGLRIAANEPLTDGNWANNDFTAFTGNRTIIDGVNNATSHELTMELTFVDGQNNDVIKLFLDGEFIGTTTTFENYRDFHPHPGVEDHDIAAEANQVGRLFFRGSASGAPNDGPGGDNQGFTFDNITYQTYDSNGADATGNELNNIIVGNSDGNVIRGMGGFDLLTGNGGDDTFTFDFAEANDGGVDIDTILDFVAGADTIELTGATVFASFELGTDVYIQLDGDHDTIIVKNASLAEVNAGLLVV